LLGRFTSSKLEISDLLLTSLILSSGCRLPLEFTLKRLPYLLLIGINVALQAQLTSIVDHHCISHINKLTAIMFTTAFSHLAKSTALRGSSSGIIGMPTNRVLTRALAAKAGQAEVVLVGCGAPNRGMGWYHAIQMLEGR
jgi:hypothetical protein